MLNKKIAVIIPTYNPSHKLVELVSDLKKAGLEKIIVINDGSEEPSSRIFAGLTQVIFLTHSENRGKGAALKTGMNYVEEYCSDCDFVLCCDDDGQHSPADIANVALKATPGKIVLGSRSFDKNVPLKSLLGNRIIAFLFFLFFRKRIKDTQTGLRLIPCEALKELVSIPYNRFEFEFASLIYFLRKKFEIIEVPIETIYFENNRKTKFKGLTDSWLIVRTLFSHFF